MDGFPSFAVAVGEEASDSVVVHDGTLVRVDELAASRHLERQAGDLGDVAGLGVDLFRYGMPWRLTEVAAGEYDWRLWDQALAACEVAGLTPIVDLLHFGLPDHLGGFCDARFIDAFCAYVDAFLARYRHPMLFTPVNEPGITATMSARFGIWNDRRASEADHVTAIANLALANVEAVARIRADRDGWWIGSEGFGTHLGVGEVGERRAAAERALDWLIWDLQLGHEPLPEIHHALDHVDPVVLRRLDALATGDHRVVAGHDFYPVSVGGFGGVDPAARAVAERVSADRTEATEWHRRYGLDFWVAETSNLGLAVDEQPAWLSALVAELDAMVDDGLPVRGICWYSRGDQFDWQTALAVPVGAVTEVGLFDDARRARPSAAAFAALAADRRG